MRFVLAKMTAAVARYDIWGVQRSVVKQSVVVSLLMLIVLQIYQPYFFLNDDNLSGWLPVAVEAARRLWAGQSPFVITYLYGGHYDLLADAAAMNLWNPLNLLFSPFAGSTARFWWVDLYVSCNLLVCAAAFAALLNHLRERYELPLSNRRLVFLCFSWTFSSYALIVNASWLQFSANQAALPLMALGWFAPTRRAGIGWCALGVGYGLLVGHLSPLLWTLFFGTLFVVGLCVIEKSREPMIRWAGSGIIVLLLALPVLLPALQGFVQTSRSGGLLLEESARLAVPLPVLLMSFVGSSLSVLGGSFELFGLKLGLGYAIASCAGAWLIFQSWGAPRRYALETLLLAMIVALTLLIVRPYWLHTLIGEWPLFRSLRFPFREIYLWLFWIHLWIALRPVTLSRPVCRVMTVLGVVAWALPLWQFGPPAFTPMQLDRQLTLSGAAGRFWDAQRPMLAQTQFVPAMPVAILQQQWKDVPFSLLGAFNYAALYRVPTGSGYAIISMSKARQRGELVPGTSGIYRPEVARRLLRENPRLKVLYLRSARPLRLEWWDVKGEHPIAPSQLSALLAAK